MNRHFRTIGTLLAAAVLLATAPAARAATTIGIEIDGDYVDGPATGEDWFAGFPPATDAFGSDDETLCGTSPAPKNDITNYFLANSQDFLYVGLERLANTGQTSFFFSFDITGDGPSKGDFIFVFCFGSGTTVTETYVLEWNETTSEWVRDATPPSVAFMVNSQRIPAPFKAYDRRGRPQTFIDEGQFAEASFDLASIEGFDICAAGAVTAELQTKSSCSLSSQCKDTSGPFVFSFDALTADLKLEQEDACNPIITAKANATGPRLPITYRWFLDGAELVGPVFTSDTVRIPVPPGQCDSHRIKVVVADPKCETVDEESFDVNFPPVAALGSVAVGNCDLVLSYDGSASQDCDGDPLTFTWDLDGDLVTDSDKSSGTWLYPGCGQRKVTLRVNDGKCSSPDVAVDVYANQPPTAGLQIVPKDCLDVDFADTSVDCDLSQTSPLYTEKLTRVIDFGDGSPSTSVETGSHAFPTCGTYDVTITETDANGCQSVATRQVSLTVSVTVK